MHEFCRDKHQKDPSEVCSAPCKARVLGLPCSPEVTLDGRLIKLNIVITGDAQQVGGYSITVSCDNANFKVDDPFLTVSITPVDDGKIGLSPTIIWIIVGAAVVAAVVILGMAIALKRRKSSVQYVSDGSDNGGFNDDYVE